MTERFGSSYLLHDSQEFRLIGAFGSTTERTGPGWIKASFSQEPGMFMLNVLGSRAVLTIKWHIAIKLVSVIQILVAQNRLLRGESLGRTMPSGAQNRLFTVEGGVRTAPLVCSWESTAQAIQHRFVEGPIPNQVELLINEEAAEELALALVEQCAKNGTALRHEIEP